MFYENLARLGTEQDSSSTQFARTRFLLNSHVLPPRSDRARRRRFAGLPEGLQVMIEIER
jgi:hypothetical protein